MSNHSNNSTHSLCQEPLSMVSDRLEMMERLTVMKTQESTTYAIGDYLKTAKLTSPASVDTICRCKMVQWCFTLVDVLQLNRATVLVAMNYLDRFLSTRSPRAIRALSDRREYQLACMTALYIAIKISEPKIMDVMQLTALSRGRYQPNDFIAMESQMLCDLGWRVNGPTPSHFLTIILDLLQPMIEIPTDVNVILEEATYQIELAVTSYDLVSQYPSSIATAALINSLQRCTLSRKRVFQNLEFVTGMNPHSSHLSQLAQCLNHLQFHTPTLSKRISPIAQSQDSITDVSSSDSKPTGRNVNGDSPKTCVSS